MKDYKRLTKSDWHNAKFDVAVNKEHRAVLHRLWELENKIERGEIDYVADKDKQIASLTAENDNLTVELEVAQRDVENLTRTLQEANDEIKALEAENSEIRATLSKMETVEKELRERLENAVELPCKVGDTIYEVSSVGIREWLVTSIELLDYGFKANCEGKNDFKLHWHFVKTDYYNDFEGKGRIRVTREAAEARLAELKGGRE